MEDWEKKLLKEWKDEMFSEPTEEENASKENLRNLMESFKAALMEHIKKYPNNSRYYLEDNHGSFHLNENMKVYVRSRHTNVERSEITRLRNEIQNLPENQGKPWQKIWEDLKV